MSVNKKIEEFDFKKIEKSWNETTFKDTKATLYELSFEILYTITKIKEDVLLSEIESDLPEGKNKYCQARRYLVYRILGWVD